MLLWCVIRQKSDAYQDTNTFVLEKEKQPSLLGGTVVDCFQTGTGFVQKWILCVQGVTVMWEVIQSGTKSRLLANYWLEPGASLFSFVDPKHLKT